MTIAIVLAAGPPVAVLDGESPLTGHTPTSPGSWSGFYASALS